MMQDKVTHEEHDKSTWPETKGVRPTTRFVGLRKQAGARTHRVTKLSQEDHHEPQQNTLWPEKERGTSRSIPGMSCRSITPKELSLSLREQVPLTQHLAAPDDFSPGPAL